MSVCVCLCVHREWMSYWDVLQGEMVRRHEEAPSAVPHIPSLTIRYEDVCDTPDATLKAVLAAAGMVWSHGANVPVVNCAPYRAQYLDHMTPKEFEEVVALTQDAITRYGYDGLIAAYRAQREEMSWDIAQPWRPSPSLVSSVNRRCTMPCDVAALCPSWSPEGEEAIPGSTVAAKLLEPPQVPYGEAKARLKAEPAVYIPHRKPVGLDSLKRKWDE